VDFQARRPRRPTRSQRAADPLPLPEWLSRLKRIEDAFMFL
jgi:hypothetical protein